MTDSLQAVERAQRFVAETFTYAYGSEAGHAEALGRRLGVAVGLLRDVLAALADTERERDRAMDRADDALATGNTAANGWRCEMDARQAAEARIAELETALRSVVDVCADVNRTFATKVNDSFGIARAALAAVELKET